MSTPILLFNGHAPGAGLLIFIAGLIALISALALLFLLWRFRSVAGLKFAGAFFLLFGLSQLILGRSPDNMFSQAFASVFSLPWHYAIETVVGEHDYASFSFALKLGAAINGVFIFLAIGAYKRINGRELSLQ